MSASAVTETRALHKRAHIRQLEALGYKVTLEPAASNPPTAALLPTRLRSRCAGY
ncbi:MAG: hypothetical protein ACRDNZ_14615 [Streptosporangiaceae bacterium]